MFARTERLLLRPSWAEDAAELHGAIADERIVRNLARAPWPYALSDAEEFVSTEASILYPSFLLTQRTDGAPRIIGGCGLHEQDGHVELGYWIARDHWGLGYATEAARALVEIARAIGHRQLRARHFVDNPASGRVLRKAGFTPSGRMAMLHSRGRNASAPCALYEQYLDGEDQAGDGAIPPKLPAPPTIRQIMQARAA